MFDPSQIGRNPNVVVVELANKVDLLSRFDFRAGKGDIISGPGQSANLITGAGISCEGRTVIGLPSRNPKGYLRPITIVFISINFSVVIAAVLLNRSRAFEPYTLLEKTR